MSRVGRAVQQSTPTGTQLAQLIGNNKATADYKEQMFATSHLLLHITLPAGFGVSNLLLFALVTLTNPK